MTLIEHELIRRIEPKELLKQNWNKHPEKSSHVIEYITWFNKVCQWAATEIIKEETPEQRAYIITKFIMIANVSTFIFLFFYFFIFLFFYFFIFHFLFFYFLFLLLFFISFIIFIFYFLFFYFYFLFFIFYYLLFIFYFFYFFLFFFIFFIFFYFFYFFLFFSVFWNLEITMGSWKFWLPLKVLQLED